MSDIVERLEGASYVMFRDGWKSSTLAQAAADKIQSLEADLSNAVEVAFERGATDWVRLNYPAMYERLSKANSPTTA